MDQTTDLERRSRDDLQKLATEWHVVLIHFIKV